MSVKSWVMNLLFGERKENVLLPEPSKPPSVRHLKDASELDGLLGPESRVLIDFTATWCGPCQKIAPFFADLSSRFATVEFVKVDVDELNEIAEKFEVKAMPTFVALRDGKEVARVVGADRAQLEDAAAKLSL